MIHCKSPRQIEGIRQSAQILARVLDSVQSSVSAGISTAELDNVARKEIHAYGAVSSFLGYQGFPAALCTSVNAEVIHGIPSKTCILRNGDVIGIDCGVQYDGYYSDSAMSISIGSAQAIIEALLHNTQKSLFDGIDAAKAGNRVQDISQAIYNTVQREGYGVVRSYCGHGVGLSVHEDPQIPNFLSVGQNPRLKPGMVLAIEPMLTLGGDEVFLADNQWTVVTSDGSISAHFEHTVAVLEDRTEILTLLE